mmetsp:Transcript_35225/g.69934  ORF Transcript_35225/g.69934 Transcript_35225/m.69934 type:complete len:109 (-) Transcript_35225:221-547(-)|eukprot:CAMPEP_0170275054 /NCGR_PEP_ID=MMETSP0116_2-20130129/37502_1 /TAXON_ID=400756 /ORGANISM="Durinskia baltica, Strain CSIRO CS-38" /LENGTH=108 /DNA_ID=CAMNT_0010526307 /DNA_START=71 /DNA_END=397 /DNA_ORIENTATION=+
MAALVRLEGPSKEFLLIEIQSLAVMEDGSPLAGQHLGILNMKGSQVTLTNGPRTLYGKVQELPKPLVLMERTGRSEPYKDTGRESAVLKAHGVVRKKAIFQQRPELSV